MPEQCLPNRRQRDAASVPVQQARPDVALQLGQLLQDGGRGERKPLGGRGDRAGVRDLGQHGQAVGVEHGSLRP
ncbi:hypothetical protein DV26_04995 [Amycolatopsis mediterranei]|nr:hypothetical protein [Amycolatopsis mediterranei]KDO11902.1 hypothetical protein DV26_04995 [Amycolatopsis mediterranei]UZF72621.1 hypothetical protein ISP_005997 [Amycolatopsis mediterranei]